MPQFSFIINNKSNVFSFCYTIARFYWGQKKLQDNVSQFDKVLPNKNLIQPELIRFVHKKFNYK